MPVPRLPVGFAQWSKHAQRQWARENVTCDVCGLEPTWNDDGDFTGKLDFDYGEPIDVTMDGRFGHKPSRYREKRPAELVDAKYTCLNCLKKGRSVCTS